MNIRAAELTDLSAILQLQVEAYQSEAELYQDYSIQPLTQTIEELEQEFASGILLKAELNGSIIGSVRGHIQDGILSIGKLIVAPSHQNQGIGTKLIKAIETWDAEVRRFELFTGHKSLKNLAMYERLGYRRFKKYLVNDSLILVYLAKTSV
ncbi:GNAT family N-acetyltransferase [Paenibacillus sp. 1011MAR3C5]|uniref:GNAT family N-acetyltransferase n=1 Tax=Paenibacillus sp. 1011MAR3C5 TaxID=1675787 RepID=UPI000E6BCA76|nr:GNAT family N-acetyltransferase [Paenibacillus sp. 1011MAR3C5]RJE90345.1 GNAT family N-acetyltransferase [Paenibacillus sp. 1011MAR3C5]